MLRRVTVFVLFAMALVGCDVYSFTGASIDPALRTVAVENVRNTSGNGPGTVGETLTETLKQKMITATNLRSVDRDGDVTFSGEILQYRYSIQAPSGNQSSDLQRITMEVRVRMNDRVNPDESWEQTFTQFIDYPVETDLATAEEGFVQELSDLLVEDIFNKAFVKW